MKRKMITKGIACLLAVATAAAAVPVSYAQESLLQVSSIAGSVLAGASTTAVTFSAVGGASEAAYAEWSAVSGATGYNVYVKKSGGSYEQIDTMLVRQYADCFRADAVGLAAGSYTLKVVPIINGTADESKAAETAAISVAAADRSGFAFSDSGKEIGTGSYGCGGYQADGTLSSDAQVIYVTADTVNTVTLSVITSSKGTTTDCTGLAAIMTARQKGYDLTPLVIRIVGEIKAEDIDGLNSNGYLQVKGCTNVTLEGIGEDATINGWGVLVRAATNVELKNFGVMLFPDDGISLDTDNSNIWVHNCDIFYGTAGSDSDQAKGDGSMDVKGDSQYVTFSYNHFWDSGKCSLCGMTSETGENWITYHHNWFDHSDSRHPRIRTMSVHVYNNYFDGNSKYGVGVTMGASAFVENNYFRNCKYPMLSSLQGTDADGAGTFSGEDGGMIKAYGNYMEGEKGLITQNDTSDKSDIDCYEASSRTEQVPSDYTTLAGGTVYNNFDTNSSIMYSYTADAAADVPSIVTANAGRMNGGDLQYAFDNSVDDEDYSVNTALMAKLTGYSSSVIAIGSGFTDETVTPDPTEPVTDPATEPTEAPTEPPTAAPTEEQEIPEIPAGATIIYASPNGTGDGTTKENPTDVLSAIAAVPAGGVIYLLEGTYTFGSPIVINYENCGTADAYKTISAYPGAEVVWDFHEMEVSDSNRGVVMDGSYWHWYGFEITGAGDNGMLLSGNSNVIEMMIFSDNQDSGLQISRYRSAADSIATWPSNNLVYNCTSKNNCDDETMENADGFAAKLTCGEGNVFDGCLSYNNSDDGWDLYAKTETGPIGAVTIRNCISFRNGYTEFGEGYGDCDGNGFKLGGDGVSVGHIVENCLAFENLNSGFTDNNNPGLDSLTSCTSYNNNIGNNGKPNYNTYRCTEGCDFTKIISYYNNDMIKNDKFVGTMENSAYFNGSTYYYVGASQAIDNGDKIGDQVTISDSDFISLEVPAMGADFHTLWRNGDGTLYNGGFAQTKESNTYAELGYKLSLDVIDPVEPTEPPTEPSTEPDPTETDPAAVVYGDADCSGKVEILDIILLSQCLMGADSLTVQGAANADVNQDAFVNSTDTLLIMQYLVKLLETLPV